jgi:hypothetical protein
MIASRFSRGLAALALCPSVFLLSAFPAAAADSASSGAVVAQAATASATLTGIVRTPGGTPVGGATVVAQGPTAGKTTTASDGAFMFTLAPGVYQITVSKGGYSTASVSDVSVSAGAPAPPLAVTVSQADLTSLRTIGSVTTTGHGTATINTGAATSSYIPAQAFTDLANPQINDVLQRTPDVTIQHMGSQADTTIIVGGAQPYETQVLFDGHPIALGQYGVWTSQYFPSFLIGGAELQSGPGNTTPFANIAVGGTVNLLTPGYTRAQTAEISAGVDNYGSQNSNFLTTGSAGGFQYVAGIGTASTNGPYFGKNECAVTPANSAQDNQPGNTGIIQFCGSTSGPLFTNGDLLKLKYNFTPTTSFEVGFTGAWGGFNPQGSAWGNSIGPTTIVSCISPYGSPNCGNPAYSSLVGKTINAYVWYPGSSVYNNQTLFSGQFRTSFGKDTLLVRPYIGAIEPEAIVGSGEGAYPAFFSEAGVVPSLAPGVQIPATGIPHPNNFESNVCPVGNVFAYSQINSPNNTIVSQDGHEECFQYPYSAFEQDKLYGSTFSYLHPFGESLLNLTYDFHGQSVFSYFNSPSNISTPLSSDRYSTISLTGYLHLITNLNLNVGLYDTRWTVAGVQPELKDGSPVLDPTGVPYLVGLGRGVSRFDPHAALIFRPTNSVSYRFAYGSSATFPFLGQVSGNASYQPFATSAPVYTGGILTEKNPALDPEVSTAYDLGADKRLGNGSVISGDLQDTVIHNVFSTLTSNDVTSAGVVGVTAPINVARLRSQLVTLKYTLAPRVGFGTTLSVAAERSIIDGIPSGAFSSTGSLPVNDVQICGNGLSTPGIPTCIPYLKGYGALTYSWRDGTYAEIGADYEGKNNSYFQPPFAVFDATYRHPVSRNAEILISAENLFNSDAYNNLPEPNAGVPLVAGAQTGQTYQQTTYLSTLIPAPARTIHVQVRLHTGR